MHTIPKVNTELRKKLQPLFAEHLHVDLGIKSILEGQSGKQIKVVVDDVFNPAIALIRYGTFGVLGGNAFHVDAGKLVQSAHDVDYGHEDLPASWQAAIVGEPVVAR
jgi:hypothetical protein